MPFYFVDRALGSVLVPTGLAEAGFEVRPHDEFFPEDAKDVDWLPEVAERGWLILTKDSHIKTRLSERLVAEAAGAKIFVLVSGNLTAADMVDIFESKAPNGKAGCHLRSCIHRESVQERRM